MATLATTEGPFAQVAPGESVTVTSSSFSRDIRSGGYGALAFEWLAPDGTPLAVITTLTSATSTQSEGGPTASFVDDTNNVTMSFTVPASATTLPMGQSYWVRASQMSPTKDIAFAGTVRIFIDEGYYADASTNQPVSDGTAAVGSAPVAAPVKGGALGTINQSEAQNAAGIVQPAGIAAGADRKVALPVSESGPAAPQVADVPGNPGLPTVSPVSNDDPTEPAIAEPSEFQLWSGLKTSAAPNSLLDGGSPSTSTSGGTPAAGIGLLAMGTVALAGTGAVMGKRRLAVAKATRR